jgi:hypothetical protein
LSFAVHCRLPTTKVFAKPSKMDAGGICALKSQPSRYERIPNAYNRVVMDEHFLLSGAAHCALQVRGRRERNFGIQTENLAEKIGNVRVSIQSQMQYFSC